MLPIVALVFASLGWKTFTEIQRHAALVNLTDDGTQPARSRDFLVDVDVELTRQLPQFLAARLGPRIADRWLVSVTSMTFFRVPDDSAVALQAVAHFPEVQQLVFSFGTLKSEDLQLISRCHNVRELALSADAVQSGWEPLAKLRKLRSLTVLCNDQLPQGLAGLEQLTELEELSLAVPELLPEHLSTIRRLRNLKRLRLLWSGSERIDFAVLAEMAQLRELQVGPNMFAVLPASHLQGISKLSQLTHLSVSANDLTDEWLDDLLPLNNLECLSLSTEKPLQGEIHKLAQLPRLQELNLDPRGASDDLLQALIDFRPLRCMRLELERDERTPHEAKLKLLERRPGFEFQKDDLFEAKWRTAPW